MGDSVDAVDLSGVQERLDAVEGLLERFLAEDLQSQLGDLDPLEKAKLHVAMAYTINSLYCSCVLLFYHTHTHIHTNKQTGLLSFLVSSLPPALRIPGICSRSCLVVASRVRMQPS